MTRTRLSDAGSLDLPPALRDAIGLLPGSEVEITESAGRLIVEPVPSADLKQEADRKLTIEEFLASIPRYDGPPITDAMIRDAIDEEAKRMWDKFERQSHENDRD